MREGGERVNEMRRARNRSAADTVRNAVYDRVTALYRGTPRSTTTCPAELFFAIAYDHRGLGKRKTIVFENVRFARWTRVQAASADLWDESG